MKIALQHAFTWTCPGCSAKNVEPASPLPRDIAAELAAEHGGDPSDYETMPTRVMCMKCRRTFAVKAPRMVE